MVDVKISELPVAGSAAGTDQLEANQAGTSRSITVAQVGTALALTGYAPLASPVFTGDPQAPTPATADNDTSIATSAFVKAQGYQTAAQVTTSLGSYLPLTGGTLSGPGTLTGTTATFSGAATVDNATWGPVGTKGELSYMAGASIVRAKGTNQLRLNYGDGSGGLAIYDGGAGMGALTGGTATFTGTVSAPGAQIQMVSTETGAVATGTTQLPWDDTIPQITEGDQYMTLAITPKSATSRLIINVTAVLSNTVVNHMTAALFQDSTANALAAAMLSVPATSMTTIHFNHIMVSGTTSATTFRVRVGGHGAGTTTFNGVASGRMLGGVMASSIVIREVA